MGYKSLKIKTNNKHSLNLIKRNEYCKVSQASNEIMLDRFYNGKGIQFPFA